MKSCRRFPYISFLFSGKILLLAVLLIYLSFAGYSINFDLTINKASLLATNGDEGGPEIAELLARTREILYQNPLVAKIFTMEGIQKSQNEGDVKSEAAFINILGVIYDMQVKMDSAVWCYNRALQLYRDTRDCAGMVNVLNNLGIIMHKQCNYDKALDCYKASLDLLQKSECKGNEADVFINMGLAYKEIGEYQKSLSFFLKAQDRYRKENNKEGLIYSNINLGTVYSLIRETGRSLAYYEEALKTSIEMCDSVNVTICLNNIAGIYSDRNDFQKALKLNDKSLKITERIGDMYGIAYSSLTIGVTFFRMNRLVESEQYLTKALKIFQDAGDLKNMAEANENLSKTYIKMGNLKAARSKLSEALSIAAKLNSNEIRRNCYLTLSLLDSLNGNFKAALSAYMAYKALSDSITNMQKNRQIAELNVRYEIDNKQKQLELLEKENMINQISLSRKTLTIYFLSGGLLLIMAGSVLVNLYLKLRSRKKITELTLRNLRQQMNPHFIFNIMNSICYSLQNNDKETSLHYLNMLSKLMRRTLDNSQYNEILISEEIDTLNLYLELESLRLKNKFRYDIRVAESIDPDQLKIPALMLQPFVENSIWHGIASKDGDGLVIIDLSQEGNLLRCRITDNGIGRTAAKEKKQNNSNNHHSMGLAITDSRLKLINSVYGRDLSVRFTDLKNDDQTIIGTSVELFLPLVSN